MCDAIPSFEPRIAPIHKRPVGRLPCGHQHDTETWKRAASNELNEPRCNHVFGFRTFEKSVPRLYNRLPIYVKSSVNIKAFKKSLKTHLFRECFDLDDGHGRQDYKC